MAAAADRSAPAKEPTGYAQSSSIGRSQQAVPGGLQLDRTGEVASLPEHRDHLAEGAHAAAGGAEAVHHVTGERIESSTVDEAVDEDPVERGLGVEHCEVASLLGGVDVHAVGSEGRLDLCAVARVEHQQHRLVGEEPLDGEVRHVLDQMARVVVEADAVAGRRSGR